MSTLRAYTREFRESAVGLVLSQGLSIRLATEDLGMPCHTLHATIATDAPMMTVKRMSRVGNRYDKP
jgi:hypothetical protein